MIVEKMVMDIGQFESIQEKISQQIDDSPSVDVSKIKTLAGFDVAFFQDKVVCAAIVFDAKTKMPIEKKYAVAKSPMPYIPGLLAFREGPVIIQAYYDLENEPDVLMLDGHGIAHERKCGLASYVGIELHKPSIGVAKNLLVGEVKDDKIIVNGEERGLTLQTKQHANPLFVSPGHLLNSQSAFDITKYFVCPPHKLPEPLHEAHRFAKKTAIKLNGGLPVKDDEECVDEESEQERLEKEYGVNSGSIV